jgi:hypothetical protein
MATIHTAVEAMVDKLVADISGENPLSAEEQALVTTAISKLTDHAKLEQAIVAVAEEHIAEAKTVLTTATEATQSASDALEKNAAHLAVLPSIQSSVSDSTTNLIQNTNDKIAALPALLGAPQHRYGEPHFILDYYDNTCVDLHGLGHNHAYGAYNAISLVDYVTGQFYAYWDAGNQTSSSNPAILLNINEKGEVSKVEKATALVGTDNTNSLLLIRLDDGSVSTAVFDKDNKRISVYDPMSFNVKLTQDLDYFSLYQDPNDHSVYVVNAELLHVLKGGDSQWQRLETRFTSQAEFIAWGTEQGHIDLTAHAFTPRNNSHKNINSYTGYNTGLSYLTLHRPTYYKEMAYTKEGLKSVDQTKAQLLACYAAENFNNAAYAFTRSFASRIELNTHDGRFSALLESRTPHNNMWANNYRNAHYTPQIIVYSPIHRALVVQQKHSFYYSGGSVIDKSRNRVYFA